MNLELLVRFAALLTAAVCLAVSMPLVQAQETADRQVDVEEVLADSGPFDRARFTPLSASHYYLNRLSLPETAFRFLPPTPPPLDTPIPLPSPLESGQPAAPELAAYINDAFYPQLASRLASDDLPRKDRQKLEAYRTAKAALQDELRAVLARTQAVDPSVRALELDTLAQLQAARLEELEATAEQIRAELGGLPPEKLAGLDIATPHPQAPSPDTALRLRVEARLLRNAAYHLNGLTPAQRRLLREAATERESRASLTNLASAFFFAPEGARLLLPPNLPPALVAQLEAYTAIRRQLADTLLATLRELLSGEPATAAQKLQDLATLQAPAFAALDAQAEQLRHALRASVDLSGIPATPSLPSDLVARITTYRQHKQTLLRQLHATLTQTARAAALPSARPGGIAVPITAFTPDQQAALATLNREKDAIRTALAETQRTAGAGQDRKSIDDLLENFERARQAQELRELFRDYRIAVLEPGLSPAQRRLLFAAALQSLALPLPSGEPLP